MTRTVECIPVTLNLRPGVVEAPVDAALLVEDGIEMKISSRTAIGFAMPVGDAVCKVVLVHAIKHSLAAVVVDLPASVNEVLNGNARVFSGAGHAFSADGSNVIVARRIAGSMKQSVVLEALMCEQ